MTYQRTSVRLAGLGGALLLGLLAGGCADGAKDEAKATYNEVTQSSAYRAASKAYNVFNFATNVTNPLYYAGKAASAGYEKYKESKGESSGD